jgi:polyisoprenoid-binding protein YceI
MEFRVMLKRKETSMRRMLLSACALAVLLSTPLAHGSDWTIDSSHSNAQFAVRHFMVSTVRGTFGAMSGLVMFNEADVSKSSVTAEVDVASVDTREAKRDEHLKSADFFDVEQHPKMSFVSKKVEKVDDTHYKVTGDMTLKGVTKEVVFDVEGSTTPIKDPWGNNRLGGVATATINRTDFGLIYNSALETGGFTIGEEVTITIDFELTPKKEEAKS